MNEDEPLGTVFSTVIFPGTKKAIIRIPMRDFEILKSNHEEIILISKEPNSHI